MPPAALREVILPFQNVRHPINGDQLALLRAVFDEACTRNGIDRDSPDGEALAVILVNAVQKGMRDREKLISLAQTLVSDR